MNNGIYLEKTSTGFWIIRDVKTRHILAIGDTIDNVMESYEVMVENLRMEKEVGYKPDII